MIALKSSRRSRKKADEVIAFSPSRPEHNKAKNRRRGRSDCRTALSIHEFLKVPRRGDQDVSVGTERSGSIITGADTYDEAYKLGLRAEALLEIEYASRSPGQMKRLPNSVIFSPATKC